MNKLLSMEEFVLNEMARMKARKCPQIDWEEVRKAPVYKDLLSTGWIEDTSMYAEKIANLWLNHPSFPGKTYKLNKNGQIRTETPGGRSDRLIIPGEVVNAVEIPCLKAEDYFIKLDYLLKLALKDMKVFDADNLKDTRTALEIVRDKMKEDPAFLKKMKQLLPSLKEDKVAKVVHKAAKFGMF